MTSTRKIAAVAALLFLVAGGGWALSIASSTPTFDSYCASERSAADAAKATRDRLEQEWRSTPTDLGRDHNWKTNPEYDRVYAEYNQSKAAFTSAADKSGECWQRWSATKSESDAKGGLAGGLAFLSVPLLVFAFWSFIRDAMSRAREAAATRSVEMKAAAETRRAERKADAEVRRAERAAEAEARRAEAAQRLADAQARAAQQAVPEFAGVSYPAASQYQTPPTTPVYDYPENAPAANPAYAQQAPVQQFSSPPVQAPPAPPRVDNSDSDDWLDVD